MRLFLFALAALSAAAANSADQTESRILPAGRIPGDGRLGSPRTLDSYHPWIPPASAGEWEKRKEFLVTQVLASQGLFPLPPRTPLNAVVHGRIDRPEYTVEKVLLNTRPGHYLAGSLFRPKGIPAGARIPAVLCPHGHWANGRFYDAGEGGAAAEIKGGGESFQPNARHVVQTIPATLARQGIIAFAYDMIGNADSAPLGHPQSSVGRFNGGMEDAGSLLRLDSFMGLQTWNSIRALDWIETLPDVDPKRIGVTGGSGGGTQTFMLCAVDPRPAAAFPAVMVSTGMQGGCVCENAPLLRVGTGNIELAALFSPKPLGMTACDDWTVEIETKGLPELKQHYAMLGHPQLVDAWFFPQFKHNYNQNTRQLMNEFFNLHLQGKKGRVVEKPIVPCTNEELSVFDSSHPRPKDFLTIPELKPVLAKEAQSRLAEILPTGAGSDEDRRRVDVLRQALAAIVVEPPGEPIALAVEEFGKTALANASFEKYAIGRKQPTRLFPAESFPLAIYRPANWSGKTALWLAEEGHASLHLEAGAAPELEKLLAAGYLVAAPDVFLTGEYHLNGKQPGPAIDKRWAGYFHGYNRGVVANRIHDAMTTIAFLKDRCSAKSVDVMAPGEAGPWGVVLSGLATPIPIRKLAVDLAAWKFADITTPDDPRLLPGALKYGDVLGMASATRAERLLVADAAKLSPSEQVTLSRRLGGRAVFPKAARAGEAVAWIVAD